jgi:hypothetical protein
MVMRPILVTAALLAALAGCDAATAPVASVPARELEATVVVSHAEVSRASPPDSLVLRIRLRNTRPYTVRIAPDSAPGAPTEVFTGVGVRWRFELVRTADSTTGNGAFYFTRDEIVLSPGQVLELRHLVRPDGGVWTGWDGEYVVHATLQGTALPLVTVRFGP